MSNKVEIKWEGQDETVLSQWFFDNGDAVEKDDVVCELMQEKVAIEVPATVSGVLEIITKEEEEITKGHTIGYIISE